SPARHRPGARSARRQRCPCHDIADRLSKGGLLMALMALLRSLSPRRHSASARCPNTRGHFRPRLEALEGRDLPSTLTVVNLSDSGPGSLRAEIAAAQNGDTVAFDPSLKAQAIFLTSGELVIDKSLDIEGPDGRPFGEPYLGVFASTS